MFFLSPERGEFVCAAIVTRDDSAPRDIAGVAAFLRARGVAPYKFPERVERHDELPRNPSGKVLKRELKKRDET